MRLHIDHFRFIAPWYDQLLVPPENDPTAALLEVEPHQLVLDIGGGTGRHTAPVAGIARVVICDLSRYMLRHARGRGLHSIRANVTRLPFPTGYADRILVVDAFHHFVDPSPQIAQPAAALELLRVLKPGGRLVIQEPDIRNRAVKGMALGESLLLMGSRFLSPPQMVRLFESSGARTLDRRNQDGTAWLIFSK